MSAAFPGRARGWLEGWLHPDRWPGRAPVFVVKEGDRVEAGERIGLIRFGSRVDVYLPAGTGSQVLLGQRTIAGETILGEVGVDPDRRGSSQ